MARAHAVWVVMSNTQDVPVRAFTVKHELVTWLSRKEPFQLIYYDIWKLPDGATEDGGSRFLSRADSNEWEKM